MPDVVSEAIRKSATQLDTVATGIRTNNPGNDLGSVPTALPGSDSGPLATTLGTTWTTRFTTLAAA